MLYLVNKLTKQKVSIIESEIECLIRQFFKSKFNGNIDSISQKDAIIIKSYLEDIRNKGYWIKCNCLDGKDVFMHTFVFSNSIGLKRCKSSEYHKESCEFFRINVSTFDKDNSESINRPPPSKGEILSPYSKVSCISKSQSISEINSKLYSGNSVRRDSVIAKIMYMLLENSGLASSTFSDKAPTIYSQRESIVRVAKDIRIAERISAADNLIFSITDKQKLIDKIESQIRFKLWGKREKPHGYLLVSATAIDDNSIFNCYSYKDENGKQVQVNTHIKTQTRVRFCNGFVGPRSSPFLVLITICKVERNGVAKYDLIHAHAIPIYKDSLYFPVESYYEREALTWLEEKCRNLGRNGVTARVSKPLFDVRVGEDEDEFCRPDFIITSPYGDIVLEVMGIDSVEYKLRKERTVPLMCRLGKVIEFNAFAADRLNDIKGQLELLKYDFYNVLNPSYRKSSKGNIK